jgi:hypothetical protein
VLRTDIFQIVRGGEMASLGESPSFRALAKISPRVLLSQVERLGDDTIPVEIGGYAESRTSLCNSRNFTARCRDAALPPERFVRCAT